MTGIILNGLHILIIEDEYFLADDARTALRDVGAVVVGPASSVDAASVALASNSQIDAALLDINLDGEATFELADTLTERGIPFTFVTGYDRTLIPDRFNAVPYLQKPVDADDLITTLVGLLPD